MANPYVQELIRRADNRFNIDSDSMSLGDWICANTHLRGRPFTFDRYPFQKAICDDLHPNIDVIKPSQVGLALALDTPIPTPSGWTIMGDLREGDMVFDEMGQPTRVDYVSPVYTDHDCFEVEFDTGEVIVADANHRWFVQGDKAFNDEELCFRTGRLPKGAGWRREGVVNTEMLSRNFRLKGRNLFAIPNTLPLQAPDKELPVDPYLLGLWLGDGSQSTGQITSHENDYQIIKKDFEDRGYVVEKKSQTGEGVTYAVNPKEAVRKHRLWEEDKVWVKTTYCSLQELGVLNNKHVPEDYMRSSPRQRRALLQGLLDSDGHVTKKGRGAFYNTDPTLVDQVVELLHSLGLKARVRWKKVKPAQMRTGHVINSQKPCAEVGFTAYVEDEVFRLPRHSERLLSRSTGRPSEALRRRIVDVRLIEPQPVRCISVASSNHLFLAGRGMIPTHNTEVQIRKALAFITRNRGTTLIFTFPLEKMFKKQSVTRIKPLVDEEKCFNLETRSGEKPARSMGLFQVGSSFMHVTNATEGDATSISADAVFNDEVDLTDQQMLALFNSRLQNSDWKINQRFSTPTFTNYGIDKGFQVSDQHEYLCKCSACNHWNAPIFRPQFVHIPGLSDDINDLTEIDEQMIDDGKIDIMGSYVKCEKCHTPLDLGNTELREWVPRFQSRTHHRGYRVSPFSTDRLPPEYVITQMLKYKSRDYMRGWYNTVLGEAFTDGNSRLSDADIAQCFTARSDVPLIDKDMPTWLGIDMGQVCHVTVGQGNSFDDMHVVRFVEVPIKELNDFVKDMLATYNVIGGAVDRFPYTPNADDLWEISNGKILPVEYRGQKSVNLVKDQVTEEVIYAQANRTQAIDAVAAAVRRKRLRFSGYGNQKTIITDHLKDMVRDENPEVEAKWVKLTGQDHYFHALAFLGLAVKLKETQRGLFSDPRTTVAIAGINMQSQDPNLFGKPQKQGGLL